MHSCIFCNEDCDCNYVDNELEDGEDSLCTGCLDCEIKRSEDSPDSAEDYGSSDYMLSDTKTHDLSYKL